MSNIRPKFGVGVGIIVIKDSKVLLGKRKGNFGNGEWSLPGGHLEFGEKIEDCAIREIKEEAGIKIKKIKKVYFTTYVSDKEPYVMLYVISKYASGNIHVMEPDYCEKWDWFTWTDLPNPLFTPIKELINENFNPVNYKID